MPKTVTVTVLISIVAMVSTVGLASTNSTVGGPGFGPAGPTTIHWDKLYDKSGNPLPGGPPDSVGTDSLYFKDYYSTTIFGCPKSQVPNPTPDSCRPGFTWLFNQTVVGMDPLGTYCYEAFGSTLRRHNTSDGSHTDYAIPLDGYEACGTDGNFVYAPVGDTVFKFTLTGTLVSSTLLDITPVYYEFSVANDTVWCGKGNDSTLYGYACSKFTGGFIIEDGIWDIGSGSATPALVGWDGQYYYVSWDGNPSNTFKRYNANRTLSASGTINIDPRGVMCKKVSPGGIAQPGNNALPLAYALHQPYPNPLASGAQIRYALPRSAHVDLRIYDVAGTLVRRLVDGGQSAGNQSAYWNGFDDRGRRVAPGVYYCRFQAGDFIAAQKLVVRQ